MCLDQDDWIKSNSWITAETLHAIGVVVIRWTMCEICMRDLTYSYLEVTKQEDKKKLDKMKEAKLCALTYESTIVKQEPLVFRKYLSSLFENYKVCKTNRDALCHCIPGPAVNENFDLGDFPKLYLMPVS